MYECGFVREVLAYVQDIDLVLLSFIAVESANILNVLLISADYSLLHL
jgi:hypothetical protein